MTVSTSVETPGSATAVYVARQPILDRTKNVYAYELLFRSSERNAYDPTVGADDSTLAVIANSLLVIGLDELTGHRPAFINFTRNLLIQDVAQHLPPGQVTVEILEDIQADEEVLAACRRLKAAGYILALDDFVLSHLGTPLLDVADIVKVDFLGTTPEQRAAIARDLQRRRIDGLAEKVETVEQFEEGLAAGYAYFQGYFFSKPVIRSGRRIAENQSCLLELLREIHRPELEFDELEAIIKRDVALTYKLLRLVNSVRFAGQRQITSVKQALLMLGSKEIRHWCTLLVLCTIGGKSKPPALISQAMTRARMAEDLASLAGMKQQTSELFLMGIFSVIDALLDVPMEEVLAKLPLDEQVKQALRGEPCRLKVILDLIVAYERGEWSVFSEQAKLLQTPEDGVASVLFQALRGLTDAVAAEEQ